MPELQSDAPQSVVEVLNNFLRSMPSLRVRVMEGGKRAYKPLSEVTDQTTVLRVLLDDLHAYRETLPKRVSKKKAKGEKAEQEETEE